MSRHAQPMTHRTRIRAYLAQNGSNTLTARQLRRARKKLGGGFHHWSAASLLTLDEIEDLK